MRSGQSSSHGKNGREFDLRTINYAVRPEGSVLAPVKRDME